MIITLKARILNQLPQICVVGAGRHAVSLIKVFILYDLNNFFINFRDIAYDWLGDRKKAHWKKAHMKKAHMYISAWEKSALGKKRTRKIAHTEKSALG